MIKDLKVSHQDWVSKERKKFNEYHVSSVFLSKHGADTSRLSKFCERSSVFHCYRVNISGTTKYWFERESLSGLLKATGESIRNF